MLTKMIINNSDFEIIRILLKNEKQTLKEIKDKTKKSRISVYKSLKKLEHLGFIDKRRNLIKLQKNPLTIALFNLMTEGFPLEYLTGNKLNILIELTNDANVCELSDKTGISIASIYRYIMEISPLLIEDSSRYRINDKNKTLIEFLKLMKSQVEFQSSRLIVWMRQTEKLIAAKKTISVSDAVLTAFSRFSDFNVEYHTIYDYYFLPKKEVSAEEILVHAICCAKDANMISVCIIFYLKNKGIMDLFKIEELSRKYGVIELWMDIIAYLENTTIKNRRRFFKPRDIFYRKNHIVCNAIKNKDMFLPGAEFLEKAKVYNTNFVIKYHGENLFSIFNEISTIRDKNNKIEIYMIGGGALIRYGVKETTKDLDLILENQIDFEILKDAFFDINFHEVADVTPAYKNLCTSTIMERKNSPRIDIFIKKVCGGIILTESMKSRAKLEFEKNNFKIYILSPEDIFLFKAYSSREGDIIDCERIILKRKLNWEVIMGEYEKQQKNMDGFSGVVILDHLEILEMRTGIRIPIIKKLIRICLENAILYLIKKPKTINEIKKEIRFKEYEIRNAVKRLVEQGEIKRIGGKPVKFGVVGGD